MKVIYNDFLCLYCFLFAATQTMANHVTSSRSSQLFDMLCQFMIKFNQIQPKLISPMPLRLVAVVNTTSGLKSSLLSSLVNADHCFIGDLHDSIPFHARHRLILLECPIISTCLSVLDALIEYNLIDKIVSPRYFLVMLTPNLEIYKTLIGNVFQNYSKVHAVVFLVNQTPKATFIRSFKNICLEEKSLLELTGNSLNLEAMFRYFLAIDKNDQVIRCNFNHQMLTAVLIKAVSCEFESINGNITKLHPSVEVNALNLLSDHYYFTYKAIDANGSYGAQVNGNWQGATGHVVNGTADMALCDLIFTNDRFRVVDMSFPFDLVPVTFMTKKPVRRIRKWAFFNTLPIIIWMMLLVSVGMLAGLLYCLSSIASVRIVDRGQGSIWLALVSVIWQQSLSNSEVAMFTWSIPLKLIFILWSFSTLIIMRVYSGVFYSTITVPEDVLPIDTIAELLEVVANDQALVFTSRFLYNMALESTCCEGDFEYVLGTHLKRNRMEAKIQFTFDQWVKEIETYDWQGTRPLYYINSRNLLHFFTRHITFGMYIGTPTFCLDAVGLIHQRDALYEGAFKWAIQNIFEAGLYIKWFRDALRVHQHRTNQQRERLKNLLIDIGGRKMSDNFLAMLHDDKHSEDELQQHLQSEFESLHNFGLAEFESLFLFYLACNTFAFVVLLVQCMLYYFVTRKKHHPHNRHQF